MVKIKSDKVFESTLKIVQVLYKYILSANSIAVATIEENQVNAQFICLSIQHQAFFLNKGRYSI